MRSFLPAGLLLLMAIAPALQADAPPPASPDKLVGLWGSERVFGPQVAGTLTLDDRSGTWHAGIAGFDVAAVKDQDGIRFQLPGDAGRFRGRLSADGKRIEGFWIQPPGVTLRSAYATPVRLMRLQAGVWSGSVSPLADRVSLYLQVSKAADGSLSARLRNPEFNLGRNNVYTLTLEGDQVKMVNSRDKDEHSQGLYDAAHDTLSVTLDGIGGFDLTRRDGGVAPGFYPRTPAAGAYAYRPPVQEDDGWRTGTPQQVGLDPKPLAALVQQIQDTRFEGAKTPYIQSLLVARHGKLVLEEYFYGFDRERVHDIRSAGKTLAGVMAGIALDHGARFTPASPAYALFPEYKDIANPDPRKQKITVADLMSMDSGLACDDDDDNSPGNEDTMEGQTAQPDWYKFTLDLPVQDAPGDRKAVYCSAAINLVGGVVRNTTHRSLLDLFQQYYAGPLDIRDYHVNLMPSTDDMYLAGGIQLRPRDFLKLGQLYLDHGVWNGHRVLSAKWTEVSTQEHSVFPATDYTPASGYGYTWHLAQVQVGGKNYAEYSAGGNGGQLVIVVPELDLVAEFTGGNYNSFPVWRTFGEQLLPQYILAAAH